MSRRQHLDHGGFSRERMVAVLRAIASQAVIPPIEVDELPDDDGYAYRVHSGAHRFYASVVVGFSHVPAVVFESAEREKNRGRP